MILLASVALAAPPEHPHPRAALRDASPGPWRATVAEVGIYELIPGRRTFSPGPSEPFDTVVVAQDDEVVWVTDDYAAVRVLVGVPPSALAPRLLDTTALALTPDDAVHSRFTTSWLAGGTPAIVEDRVGTPPALLLGWAEDALVVEGWAAESALGPVWRSAPFVGAHAPSTLGRVDPERPLAIRAEVDGAVIGVLRKEYLSLQPAGPVEGAWRRVEATTAQARVVGWVLTSEVTETGPSRWGSGSGGGYGSATDVAWVELPAGTWVYPDGGAAPMARVLEDTTLILGKGTAGGRTDVTVNTRWGYLPGQVVCATQRAAVDPRASYRCGR